jgi:hypothetical protein
VYKLDSFVGFIGDEHIQALECYVPLKGVVAVLKAPIGCLKCIN